MTLAVTLTVTISDSDTVTVTVKMTVTLTLTVTLTQVSINKNTEFYVKQLLTTCQISFSRRASIFGTELWSCFSASFVNSRGQTNATGTGTRASLIPELYDHMHVGPRGGGGLCKPVYQDTRIPGYE